MINLTKLERETIINFNEDEEFAEIYTASPVVIRRLIKRGYTPENNEITIGKSFKVPKVDIKLPLNRDRGRKTHKK